MMRKLYHMEYLGILFDFQIFHMNLLLFTAIMGTQGRLCVLFTDFDIELKLL